MNKLNSDQELRYILQEAREDYQKRIANLKTSMQSIYNDIPCQMNESEKNTKRTYSSRRGSIGEKEFSNYIPNTKALHLNAENSKSVVCFENASTKTKSICPYTSRRESIESKSENYLLTAEINKLNDLMILSERENKELKHMLDTLKFENKALEENLMKSRKKISDLTEEHIALGKKIQDLEDYVEKCKYENKEYKQTNFKMQAVENERNLLEREIKKYKNLISGSSYETVKGHYKSKIKYLKKCLEDKQNDISKFKSALEELENELRNSYEIEKQATIVEFEQQIQMLKEKIIEMNEENIKIQEKYTELKNKESNALQSTKMLEKIQEEKIKLNEKVLEMNNTISELSEKLSTLNKNHCSLIEELSQTSSKNYKISSENQKLTQEITVLKEKLYELSQNSLEINKTHSENESKLKSIESTYENKLNLIKNELNQRAEKEINNLISQLNSIETEYKSKLHDKIIKISELEDKNQNIQKSYNDLLITYNDLNSKNNSLQQDFCQSSKNTKTIVNISEEVYQKEFLQQKNNILALETEMQKVCESNGKLTTENEMFKEKYKVLKNEFMELQQKFMLNSNIFEKQLEEFKKNYILQEKEIEFYRNKDAEYQSYTPRVEKLAADLRNSEEVKNELKNNVIKMREEMKSDQVKISNLRDMVKIGLKQMKNEYFKNMKAIHRMAFEEFTNYKKILVESFALLVTKINFHIKSIQLSVNIQKTHQKQYQNGYGKEEDDLNSLKQKFSQLAKEITLRDDRISYLEKSLKMKCKNKNYDQEIIKGVVNQVTGIEESYMENCKEMVDMVVLLKSLMQKEFMEYKVLNCCKCNKLV
ncbi:hypothetical protein SteCoe_34584 [Stentor coeruleus]|uniref:Uncharacterized protein n=1 Tax=Stentor coeruleus TaxID=5963 RepID=A0A1R2AU65_9CILI|nr:hypothetical protein SteCoe_34584 [Stentor coeruleus]